jgi:hypothetical protein
MRRVRSNKSTTGGAVGDSRPQLLAVHSNARRLYCCMTVARTARKTVRGTSNGRRRVSLPAAAQSHARQGKVAKNTPLSDVISSC